MTLTKAHLTDSIASQLNLPKYRSARLVDSVMEIIKGTLENGEDILIRGFGKFCIKSNNEKRGRKPKTGCMSEEGRGKGVTFKCSPSLLKKINRKP